MSSKSAVRSCADVDEVALSYAEIKALCAGNPLIKKRMDIEIEVARLRLLKSEHQSQRYRLEDAIAKWYPESIRNTEMRIAGLKKDMALAAKHTPADPEAFTPITFDGITYTEKDKAGEAMLEAYKLWKGSAVKIGEYRGFELLLDFNLIDKKYAITLKGSISHKKEAAKTLSGNMDRFNAALDEIPTLLRSAEAHLDNLHQQTREAENEITKVFPYEEELAIKSMRLIALDSELDIGGGDMEAAIDTNPTHTSSPKATNVLYCIRVMKNGKEL
jgi:hypothetical protein